MLFGNTKSGKDLDVLLVDYITAHNPIGVKLTESDEAKPAGHVTLDLSDILNDIQQVRETRLDDGIDEGDGSQSGWMITTNDEGTEMHTPISTERVLEAINKDKGGRLLELFKSSISIVKTDYGGGLVEFDVHPDMVTTFGEGSACGSGVPLMECIDAGLLPGRYFGLYNIVTDENIDDDKERIIAQSEASKKGLLLATRDTQVTGTGATPLQVTLKHLEYENESPYEKLELWMVQDNDTYDLATVSDLLDGLASLAALQMLTECGAIQSGDEESAIEAIEQLPEITTSAIKHLDFPLDKANRNIWTILENAPDGHYGISSDPDSEEYDPDEVGGVINLKTSRATDTQETYVTYCIDFSELTDITISKKLEPYDKRVYIAIAALYNAGYEYISLQQIYNAMGYTGKMGKKDKTKINNSITKMNMAHIEVDNISEIKGMYKYPHFKYDGSFLPMERVQAIVNGQVAESVVHPFREPPMQAFARQRKQITTIDIKLLNTPLSKTSANIQLEDYLIERIARIKKNRGRTSNKIRYDTLFKNVGAKSRVQKQRLTTGTKNRPSRIKRVLEHFKKCGFIKGYKTVSDGIEIFY